MAEQIGAVPSHRDHFLRKIQNIFGGHELQIIHFLHARSFLDHTEISRKIGAGKNIVPDDITLTGLELTLRGQILGFLMDGLDGSLARSMEISSISGSIKDACTDRMGDFYLASVVSMFDPEIISDPELLHKLQVSCVASTLSKALCAMHNIKTEEGKQGSMLSRRKTLHQSLMAIKFFKKTGFAPHGLFQSIHRNNRNIINSSLNRTKDRASQILYAENTGQSWKQNPDLTNSKTFAFQEACKYAGVLKMCQKMGIDPLPTLNLIGFNQFPSPEEIFELYPTVKTVVDEANEFINHAIEIAGLNIHHLGRTNKPTPGVGLM